MVSETKTPQTLMAAMRHFDPDTAEAYVRSIKWPDGPVCPKCGSMSVGTIKSRNRYQCREKGCRKQFSLLTGTIFEGTHLRLDQWVVAVWMIVSCRNGVSSCEIARTIGCKQQSAWHLLHRVRHVLQQDTSEPLAGTVEADATFVGGLVKFMREHKKQEAYEKGSWGKSVVHGLKERRTGRIRAEVLPSATYDCIQPMIVRNIKRGSRICTDEARSYMWLTGSAFRHETVNHKYEYVRGIVHTNGCENFFNCLRRGLKGTYVRASPKHLAAYVDEQVYRFNARKETEWERFHGAMKGIVGKRLTYSNLTGGAVR